MKIAGRRVFGTTMAALTIVAGMSAVAFAGQPAEEQIKEFGKAGGDGKMAAFTVSLKAIPQENDGESIGFKLVSPDGEKMEAEFAPSSESIQAEVADIKIDEETGEISVSYDGGKTWEVLDIKYADTIEAAETVEAQPAKAE